MGAVRKLKGLRCGYANEIRHPLSLGFVPGGPCLGMLPPQFATGATYLQGGTETSEWLEC